MRRLFVCLLLCGCGEASSSAHGPGDHGSGPRTGKIRLIPNVVAGTQALKSNTGAKTGSQESAIRVGSPSAMNLISLKYYITSIQLCQNLEQMGSGFSSAVGCIALYQNESAAASDYANYLVTQAEQDTASDHFIDLMSPEGQAALRKPVTLEVPIAADPDAGVADAGPASPSSEGAYRFGLINFFRPIKVKAEFPIVGRPGEYFRTRAVTHVTTGSSIDGHNSERVQIGDTLSGPTEETTYMLNNGGALFTFQKPFVITQADIEAQAEIKVDLVFNPENFGQAYEAMNCADQPWIAICDPANNVAIDMPYVRMNPVPRKAGEKTRKETYLMDWEASSKLRIELYYNDADAEAGVQGVDMAVVYGTTAPIGDMPYRNTVSSAFVSQTGSVSSNDAALTFYDYDHTPSLEGLLRRHDGNASLHCSLPSAICPSAGVTIGRAYAYVEDRVVSAD
jgi:hypothetical protein